MFILCMSGCPLSASCCAMRYRVVSSASMPASWLRFACSARTRLQCATRTQPHTAGITHFRKAWEHRRGEEGGGGGVGVGWGGGGWGGGGMES